MKLDSSTRFSTSILLFCRREGTTSSAIIELLMSRQIMVSMPLRFSREIFVPICGRASTTMSRASAACRSQNFTVGRNFETSGMSSFSKAGSPNLRSLRRRWCHPQNRSKANTGMMSSSQRNIGFSNLNTVFFLFSILRNNGITILAIAVYGMRRRTVVRNRISSSSNTKAAKAKGRYAS